MEDKEEERERRRKSNISRIVMVISVYF